LIQTPKLASKTLKKIHGWDELTTNLYETCLSYIMIMALSSTTPSFGSLWGWVGSDFGHVGWLSTCEAMHKGVDVLLFV
jgi:hypothetical protein